MSLRDRILAVAGRRPPDFVIGGQDRPYLKRWHLIPRNLVLNVYLHQFLRSDDDRALHDHPWASLSIILQGAYIEHFDEHGQRIQKVCTRGVSRWRLSGKFAHRIELFNGPCWSLFITGPRYRRWGFHCPQGWVHWKAFTSPADKGAIGRGCA